MNISERTPDFRPLRRLSVFATQIVLTGTLVACAESQSLDDDTVTTASSSPAGRPDSGPQSNDGSNSVSYAQAIAAAEADDSDGGIIIVAGTDSDTEDTDTAPDTGAALPDSENSSDSDTSDAETDSPRNPFEPVPDAEAEAEAEADPEPTDSPDEDSNADADAGDSGNDEMGQQASGSDEDSGQNLTDSESSDTDTSQDSTNEEVAVDESEPSTETEDATTTEEPSSGSSEDSSNVVAAESSGDVESEEQPDDGRKSKSHTTPGFEGEVIDGAIKVTWNADPLARGYNVYRQAQYVTTVMTNEYIDTDVYDRDYYYEIQAFDYDDVLYYIATGLTVSPTTLGKNDPNEPVPNNNRLDDYELVFSEEFTGMTLDSSKWNTAYLWGPNLVINSEEQYYVDILRDPDFGFNPFTFDGEHMTINSIETPPELAQKAMNQPYLSGVITSYDAFKFTYGYAETRAKMTFGRGYWPAFWLLNAYYGGDDPEIDIMEFIGQDQDVVYHTYHYYDADGTLRSTKSKPTPGIDFTADFHTFAVEWMPGLLIFLVDGIEVHRVTDTKVSSEEMYVIANTAIGGWWAGSPDITTPFPGEYTIDYIRVYQRITPFDDVLLNDGMSNVPYADDIPGQSSPSHRPSPEQWPEGYPYLQR